jgi:hypothetical protein
MIKTVVTALAIWLTAMCLLFFFLVVIGEM